MTVAAVPAIDWILPSGKKLLTGAAFLAIFYRTIQFIQAAEGGLMKSRIHSPAACVRTASELGALMRAVRKDQHLTLEKVSGLSHLSMRFLSELERGKETAELGKALTALNYLGLEIVIQPRGTLQVQERMMKKIHQRDAQDGQ